MASQTGESGKGWLCAVLVTASLYTSTAHADIMVRVEESFNGRLPTTVLHWFGPGRSTRDDGNRYVVTRLDEDTIYTIDRLAQNYKVDPLPPMPENSGPPDVRAIRSDETRNIGKWTARKYQVVGAATAGMDIVIWASSDINIDLDSFRQIMAGLARRPGSEWMAVYREIKGFPVLQEVQLQHEGVTFFGQTRVIDVEQREPPENIYAPPEDYEKIN